MERRRHEDSLSACLHSDPILQHVSLEPCFLKFNTTLFGLDDIVECYQMCVCLSTTYRSSRIGFNSFHLSSGIRNYRVTQDSMRKRQSVNTTPPRRIYIILSLSMLLFRFQRKTTLSPPHHTTPPITDISTLYPCFLQGFRDEFFSVSSADYWLPQRVFHIQRLIRNELFRDR